MPKAVAIKMVILNICTQTGFRMEERSFLTSKIDRKKRASPFKAKDVITKISNQIREVALCFKCNKSVIM